MVTIATMCDRIDELADCNCTLCSFFTGLECDRATTTVEVAQLPITWNDYVTQHHLRLRRAGALTDSDSWSIATQVAEVITSIASDFPVGVVLQRQGSAILRRPE
ncbi:hypothetical protein GCM10022222_84450 [Amycolatopsis ultiminotia]|uniref:DUF7715 domain-containing protein n=2 Tax=Amycolatopsis ultiminotia TaxID=543629 RepID=A0ABP6YPH4_9PSEU